MTSLQNIFSFIGSHLGSLNNRETYCVSSSHQMLESEKFLDDHLLQWFSICGARSSEFCPQQPLGRGHIWQSPMRWVSRHPFLLYLEAPDFVQCLHFEEHQTIKSWCVSTASRSHSKRVADRRMIFHLPTPHEVLFLTIPWAFVLCHSWKSKCLCLFQLFITSLFPLSKLLLGKRLVSIAL